MVVIIKTASNFEDDIRYDWDVCDWLNANPDIKAVLDGVMAEYLRAVSKHPFFATDVVHAAAIVTEEAGELCKAANDVYHYDDNVIDRVNLHVEAQQVAAMGIRFLLEIGNLKGAR